LELRKFFKKRVDGPEAALYKPPSAPNDSSSRVALLQVNMTERDTQTAEGCLNSLKDELQEVDLMYLFQDNTPNFCVRLLKRQFV
jgi:hypothetical protein